MLSKPLLTTALSALLAGSQPTPPPDAPREDQRVTLPAEHPQGLVEPPPRPSALPVVTSLTVGLGCGVAALLLYRQAQNDDAQLRSNEYTARSQVLQLTADGARAQTEAAVIAGVGLLSLGVAGYLLFRPEPHAKPTLAVTPTAGGAFAVFGGRW